MNEKENEITIRGLCSDCDKYIEIACQVNNSEDRIYFDYLMEIFKKDIKHEQLDTILNLKPEDIECTNQKWIVHCFRAIDLYERIKKGEVKICCNGNLSIIDGPDHLKEPFDIMRKLGVTCGLFHAFSSINPFKPIKDDHDSIDFSDIIWGSKCGYLLDLRQTKYISDLIDF